jgi:hypothetical protein
MKEEGGDTEGQRERGNKRKTNEGPTETDNKFANVKVIYRKVRCPTGTLCPNTSCALTHTTVSSLFMLLINKTRRSPIQAAPYLTPQ